MRRGRNSKGLKFTKEQPRISFEILDEYDQSARVDAALLEISNGRVGLFVDKPLKVGQIVRFSKSKVAEKQLPNRGIVIWTMKEDDKTKVTLNALDDGSI